MKVNANTLRAGNVIEYNGKLMVVSKSEILTPGKGAAVIKIEMKDIKTGNKDNVTFRTQETVERVRLEQHECQFLYKDEDGCHFMNNASYEQFMVSEDLIGEQAAFLQDGMEVVVETYENQPLSVELPPTVTCEIVEAEPVVKGQTATTSYKPAILDNGVKVMVPPFVEQGTRIVVRTEDFTYIERAKD
tara:strand:- start:493 stop:1059 length:567 start_codon:yes stop_codon:yes gene_type:complete